MADDPGAVIHRPPCPHMNFEAHVQVDRLEDSGRFVASVNVRCAECGTRFQWRGLPCGLDLDGCMVSVDGFELRGAIVPDAHLTSVMADDERTRFPRGFEIRPPDEGRRSTDVGPDP